MKPKTIVEVGTWNGDHALIMAAAALRHGDHVHYWGFDLFEDADQQSDSREFNVRSHHSVHSVTDKLARFQANNPGFSFDLIRGNSMQTLAAKLEAAWTDPDSGRTYQLKDADFAYIDGGHSVATVASDYGHLQNCPAVVFDDYYEPDMAGRCPDTDAIGCNRTVAAIPHIILPAQDELPTGGLIKMAAAGPDIMARVARPLPTGTPAPVRRCVVTTFSAAGYQEYGRRFIETFEAHWPEDVELYIYCEDILPEQTSARIKVVNFYKACPEMVAFKARHLSNARAHGIGDDGKEDYRFNAVKFCHKVFAATDCALNSGAGKMYWIDADCVTFDAVTHEWLERVLPKGFYTSYLGRNNTHSECGFMGFDLGHACSREFMTFWRQIYDEDLVFDLPEWHDSYVYDMIRNTYQAKGLITAFDLRDDRDADHHPFVNSPLGEAMDHLIGPRRKIAGCSFAIDIKIPREEFYWQVVPLIAEDLVTGVAQKLSGRGKGERP